MWEVSSAEVSWETKGYIAFVVAAVIFVGVLEYTFKECIEIVGNPSKVTSPHKLFWLRILFGRARSRCMGTVSEMHVPVALRKPLYNFFAAMYGIDMSEIRYPVDSYKSFQEFFSRSLVDGVRPIANLPSGLVSPVDAQVMTHGTVSSRDARLEQVKGATYSLPTFLGVEPMEQKSNASSVVHYVVLYLAPGDYHRIHSPSEVNFKQGRHFSGEMLPMRRRLLQRVADVFTVNERVVLSGQWALGQLHLVAVAAYNVGNIWLDFDHELKTNRMCDIAVHCGGDISNKLYPGGVKLSAGDLVGGFLLGSTVVIVFDAPESFEWKVKSGDKVKVGQALGEALGVAG